MSEFIIDWRLLPEDTHTAVVTFGSKEHGLRVATKWDGCSDIWITEEEDGIAQTCYHHICDLDELIAVLQDVRAKGRAYFDGEFCVAPLCQDERDQKVATLLDGEVPHD